MATRVCSYSKINLGLAIGPVRADGFHGLATLYQTLALCDLVTVEVGSRFGVRGSRESRITLTTNHPGVPTDGRNTAWKMVERALAALGLDAEVKIHIQKELPVQGGMGAGSANAAAALLGLERELGLEVPGRMEIAAEVGSDVPLFLIGGAVLGTGRGEVVEAMPDLPRTWCVVAVPEVGVSTPRAFKDWDELHPRSQKRDLGHPAEREKTKFGGLSASLRSGRDDWAVGGGLTSEVRPDRLEELSHVVASVFGARTSDTSGIVRSRQDLINSETEQGGFEEQGFTSEQGSVLNGLAGNTLLALVRTGIENDFEQVVFPQYPLLREIKHELMGPPADGAAIGTVPNPARPDDLSGKALYAALSGSGSALFGLYRSEQDARAAQQRVQAFGCRAILTETLPRAEYWARMFAE